MLSIVSCRRTASRLKDKGPGNSALNKKKKHFQTAVSATSSSTFLQEIQLSGKPLLHAMNLEENWATRQSCMRSHCHPEAVPTSWLRGLSISSSVGTWKFFIFNLKINCKLPLLSATHQWFPHSFPFRLTCFGQVCFFPVDTLCNLSLQSTVKSR